MRDELKLRTYEEKPVDLPAEDARFLDQDEDVSNKLRIRKTVDGRLLLDPQQYVGVVALPSGLRLSISPRISAANVLFMLAVAYQFPEHFFKELESFERFDELLEPVAAYFADLVEERIGEGLYRAYVEAEANLPVVRGRIDFIRDLRLNCVLRQRVYCRFSELTWDIRENQLLRYLCHLLARRWAFRRVELRQRLMALDNQLDEVTLVPFTSDEARNFNYHRLNEPYKQVHRLCSLLLESSSISELAGRFEFRTFLLDMNKLFEQFVTQALIDRFPSPWGIDSQKTGFLGERGKVRMRPDIVISYLGACRSVADCKYKPVPDETGYAAQDYYQVVSYCTALGVDQGVLIYPRQEAPIQDEVEVRNSKVRIKRLSLDLSVPASQLHQECDALAHKLKSFSLEDAVLEAA